MKLSLIVLLAAALAACAGPGSRIKHNQSLFDSYPPEVQQSIRAGKAAVGFTMEQARMAVGAPDRVSTETSAGLTREVWVYGGGGGGSRVGFGLGFGMFSGRGTSVGSSVGVDSAVRDDRLRLTFENGLIVSIKQRSS